MTETSRHYSDREMAVILHLAAELETQMIAEGDAPAQPGKAALSPS
ncbi:MAG: hypothetical protein ACREL7_15785 [Longimicrobiales bacterium]